MPVEAGPLHDLGDLGEDPTAACTYLMRKDLMAIDRPRVIHPARPSRRITVFHAWQAEGKCAVGASLRICPSCAVRSIIVCGLVHSHVQPPGRVAPACLRRSHCRHRLRCSPGDVGSRQWNKRKRYENGTILSPGKGTTTRPCLSTRDIPDELIRRRESFQTTSARSCAAVTEPSAVCLCNGALPAGARFQGSAARRSPRGAHHTSEPTACP